MSASQPETVFEENEDSDPEEKKSANDDDDEPVVIETYEAEISPIRLNEGNAIMSPI